MRGVLAWRDRWAKVKRDQPNLTRGGTILPMRASVRALLGCPDTCAVPYKQRETMIRMIGWVRQDATIHATYIYCAIVVIFIFLSNISICFVKYICYQLCIPILLGDSNSWIFKLCYCVRVSKGNVLLIKLAIRNDTQGLLLTPVERHSRVRKRIAEVLQTSIISELLEDTHAFQFLWRCTLLKPWSQDFLSSRKCVHTFPKGPIRI